MDLLLQDIRYAVRRLTSSPFFTSMAILIVGVGIAANTTVFSAVDAVLLRPRPFAQLDRLVHLYQDSDEGQPQTSSFPAYRAMAARGDVFSNTAAVFSSAVNVQTDVGVRQSSVEFATASYFPVLGLSPTSGRWFSSDEDTQGAPATAVVSYHAWRTRFGSDPAIVGRTLRLGASPVTIVGIGPEAFNGMASGVAIDFWLPLAALGSVGGAFMAGTLERPQDHWFLASARLRDGVTLAQARAAMNAVSDELGTRFAGLDQKRRISVLPAADVRIHPSVDRTLLPTAMFAMGIVGLVLALVCTNLATLLLLRGAAQQREVSIRIAMGAGRSRIFRQFLTESLLLSLAGGLIGGIGARALIGLMSSVDVPLAPGLVHATVDYRVIGFATVLSVITGVAFGLAPAFRATVTDTVGVIGGFSASRRRVVLKYSMVAFQVALSLVLLVGTGLIIRSIAQMERVNVGFNRDRITVLTTNAFQAGYNDPQKARQIYSEIEARITALPDAESVVLASQLPVARRPTSTLAIEGHVSPTGTNTAEVPGSGVSANYFEALRIPILHGRALRQQDDRNAPPVAVVSEAMARRYWGTADVVGRRYRHDGAPDSWVEIVGVAANVKVTSLTEQPSPQLYRPVGQQVAPVLSFLVRSRSDGQDMAATLRRVLREVDPALPLLRAATMDDYLARELAIPRLSATVLSGFSLVALVLAALGLYAVVAFAVGERARELGIRMALGARAPHVIWTTVRGVMLTVAGGVALGILLALGVGQTMRSILFNVSPTDPTTLIVVTVILAAVAAIAAVIPARRATRVDPLVVLRYQ